MSDHLLRDHAPLTPRTWELVDEEARDTLRVALAGRRVVDVVGPLGWDRAAEPTGRIDRLDAGPSDSVVARRRRVVPLVELECPIVLPRAELEAVARGAEDPDLSAVVAAAEHLAAAENTTIFHGFSAGGLPGVVDASPHEAIPLPAEPAAHPLAVIDAMETLRAAGVGGPYALALDVELFTALQKATDPNGRPVLERLRRTVDGPLVRTPALRGAVLLSRRGGDFRLSLGGDLSIGYRHHDAEHVRLYLVESLAFQVIGPEAAVALHRA